MTIQTEFGDIGDTLARLKYELLGIKFELKLRKQARSMKAGFNPDQPRDELGMWSDGGGAAPADDGTSSGNQVSAAFADLASFPLATRIAKIFGDGGTDGAEAVLQTVGAQITYDTARTGIPTIDETTEKLSATLIDTMNRMEFIPNQAANVYGIAVHTSFATSVNPQTCPALGRMASRKHSR
jgi:hypothetical protein